MAKADRPKREKNYDVKGFGLGAAILTATQLKELHSLVAKVVGSLNDPTSSVLKEQLEARLRSADIDVDQHIPIRAFANRSILDPKHADLHTLAAPSQLEKVEQAISECKAIRLNVKQEGEWVEQTVWPLQILFHNIAWYLAYQSTDIGEAITVARLDRLKLIGLLPNQRGVRQMLAAQKRLHLLCQRCGGIFLSREWQHQQDILGLCFQAVEGKHEPLESLSRTQLDELIKKGSMQRVRFRCTPDVFAFMREGFNRYPLEQIRLSGPRPGDDWQLPDVGSEPLQPLPGEQENHPYPVELILPSWTVDRDIDFRRWLLGFDRRIVIEAPESLKQRHHEFGAGIAALYASPASPSRDDQAAPPQWHP